MAQEGRFKSVDYETENVIKTSKQLVDEAKNKIRKLQDGEEIPIVTRYSHLNDNLLGGFFNGIIMTIAALSGFGKTTILKHIEEDLFNPLLNAHHEEIVLLKCNYEMTVFNLLLRRLKETMKRKMKDILSSRGTEEQQSLFDDVVLQESNPNIYYIEKPLSPQDWYETVHEFILTHQDKRSICITVDHLALVKDSGNKKQAMDQMLEYMNDLKKEFGNVFFIILSQMNRDLESRTDIKTMQPKASDLYNSSNIMFISDLVLIIHNPFKLGIQKYMLFNPSRYPHLENFMLDSRRDYTNFGTKNCIFWHYVKLRQDDKDEDTDVDNTLHVEFLYPQMRKELIKEYEVSQIASFELPKLDPRDGIFTDDDEDYPF